jgi:voltage-gated potassium channel
VDPEAPRRSGNWVERRLASKAVRPRNAAYIITAFWALAVILFGTVESLIDPKTFHTVWLGLWWAVETVTTVGYGDVVPAQTAGKIIAAFLMLGGLSLLAVITAAITSVFVSRAEAQREAARGDQTDPIGQKLDQLAAQLAEIRSQLDQQHPATRPDEPNPR